MLLPTFLSKRSLEIQRRLQNMFRLKVLILAVLISSCGLAPMPGQDARDAAKIESLMSDVAELKCGEKGVKSIIHNENQSRYSIKCN
jgi:hypothetical protein